MSPFRFVRFAREVGTVPERALNPRYAYVKEEQLPSSEGILPCKELLCSANSSRSVKFDSWGIVPLNKLSFRYKNLSLFGSFSGMVLERELPPGCKD